MGRFSCWSLAAPAALVLATLSRSALAQLALPIHVEREVGAEDCPDTSGLVAAVGAIIGDAPRAASPDYVVTFGRTAQAFTAAIRSSAADGVVRQLEARDPRCAALAHATAVTLALLFDAQPPEPEPEPAAKPPPALPTRLPDEPSPAPPALELAPQPLLSLGAAALVGVLRPVAPALLADAGVALSRFRFSIGAVWALPRTVELVPGRVHERLLSGSARACYAAAESRALRLDVCAGVLLGVATAEARGFTANRRENQLFLAFPAELSLSARSGRVGWQMGAAALLQAPPHEFSVAGVGSVYRPSALAGLFTLRALFEPPR